MSLSDNLFLILVIIFLVIEKTLLVEVGFTVNIAL